MNDMEEVQQKQEREFKPVDNVLLGERQEDEEFWAYKMRMRFLNKALKARLKGRLVWDSQEKGTYVKPKK